MCPSLSSRLGSYRILLYIATLWNPSHPFGYATFCSYSFVVMADKKFSKCCYTLIDIWIHLNKRIFYEFDVLILCGSFWREYFVLFFFFIKRKTSWGWLFCKQHRLFLYFLIINAVIILWDDQHRYKVIENSTGKLWGLIERIVTLLINIHS